MRVVALILFIVGGALTSFGQTGNYFLSHYSPNRDEIDHLSFDIAQDSRGVLYFANKAGVLQFDGRNWLLVHTPGPVYTVTVSTAGQVYAGGLSGFGRIIEQESGSVYEAISASEPLARSIFQSASTGDFVYFISGDALFVVNAASGVVEKTLTPSKDQIAFKGLFKIEDNVYVTTEGDEVLSVKNSSLERSQINPSAGEILFAHTLGTTGKTLIGTSADRIFVYQNNSLTEIIIKDLDYLHSNVMVSGAWVNETLIALGTLRGGVIFVNPAGETQEITNYYTGLPDNEVFALLGDQQGNIWVAHDYGYTRIAPFLPFRTFNHYPGLEGNLLCAYSMEESVYVGTTLGLFKLVKDEIYEEEAYYVSKKKTVNAAPAVREQEPPTETEPAKAKRGFLGIGKKKEKKKAEEAAKAAPTTKEPAATSTVNTREKRTRKILKSLQYRYKKVDGIYGKVTSLINVNGSLIAAGLGGVFVINDLSSTPISQQPVRSVFLSPSLGQLFVSTYDEEVKSFRKDEKRWTETHLLDTLQEYVSYIFEDKLENLWLCGRAGVFKVEMIDKAITNVEEIPYLKPSIDETVGLAVGSDVYVVNAGEFNIFDQGNNVFAAYDSLPGTRKYFASAGSFWFHDGHAWRTIDKTLTKKMQLDWLGLFSDIRYLATTTGTPGLWVITANNELYRFTPTAEERPGVFPLFLKGIRLQEARIVRTRELQIDEEKGGLTFEFIQPDYNGFQSIEYRYLLSGLDVWSDWSPESQVTFPHLSSGEYQISVQSKNIFGRVNELEKIYFSVLPPYWRRWWFYGLEVLFFSALVLLSVKLSVSNPKYKPISRVLSLLTVIMFIQLVQTGVYALINLSSSPVIEFLIQVFIALLVLPLELRLRLFMEQASEGKYDITKLLSRKLDFE